MVLYVADTGPEEEGRWIMLNPCGMTSTGQSKSSFMSVPCVSEENLPCSHEDISRLALWVDVSIMCFLVWASWYLFLLC